MDHFVSSLDKATWKEVKGEETTGKLVAMQLARMVIALQFITKFVA